MATLTNRLDDEKTHEDWQIAEIEAGLAEANRDEFATADDLSRVIAKYVSSEQKA